MNRHLLQLSQIRGQEKDQEHLSDIEGITAAGKKSGRSLASLTPWKPSVIINRSIDQSRSESFRLLSQRETSLYRRERLEREDSSHVSNDGSGEVGQYFRQVQQGEIRPAVLCSRNVFGRQSKRRSPARLDVERGD